MRLRITNLFNSKILTNVYAKNAGNQYIQQIINSRTYNPIKGYAYAFQLLTDPLFDIYQISKKQQERKAQIQK